MSSIVRRTTTTHRLYQPFLRAAGLTAALLLSQAAAGAPAVETLMIRRADDSAMAVYLEGRAAGARQSVLLVLQGSQCGSVAPDGDDRLGYTSPRSLVRMDIEKYAISPANQGSQTKPCPEDYLAHNSVDQRVLDVLLAVAHLREQAPWWNGRLYLMGTSEGATIAALAGPLIPETRGIVTINGSVGRPFRDGWADAMVASVAAAGGGAKEQEEARREAEDTWRQVRAEPTPAKQAFGNGNTWLWWASIIDKQPSNALLLTGAPILVMQADHDEMNPVAAGRAVAETFRKAGKNNLTYVELAGLTHGLRKLDGTPGWEPVMAKVSDWITAQEARKGGKPAK